ncbi:MAG: PhoH family protein, partial [Rubrivivax sp.]|nr:PhoH family protein [Rubrivivax sp.]
MIRRHRLADADHHRLAHLCGPLDAHLREIEAVLAVRIQRRDAEFRIEGPREAVQRTTQLLDRLHEEAARPLDEERLRLALVEAAGAGATAGGPA